MSMNSKIVFKIDLDPICSCGEDTETYAHFLLNCPKLSKGKINFPQYRRKYQFSILTTSDFKFTDTILYGDSNSNNSTNTLILFYFPTHDEDVWRL